VPSAPSVTPAASGTRDGARREILAAVQALPDRSGAGDVAVAVAVAEVIQEMHRRGTGYAAGTIATMMTARLRAQACGPDIADYDDLTRTARGRYRPRSTESTSG